MIKVTHHCTFTFGTIFTSKKLVTLEDFVKSWLNYEKSLRQNLGSVDFEAISSNYQSTTVYKKTNMKYSIWSLSCHVFY